MRVIFHRGWCRAASVGIAVVLLGLTAACSGQNDQHQAMSSTTPGSTEMDALLDEAVCLLQGGGGDS